MFGSASAVRSFGRTLAKDPAKALLGAVALATRMGMAPTKDMSEEAKAELAGLRPPFQPQ